MNEDVEISMLLGDISSNEVKEIGERVFLGIVWRLVEGCEFEVDGNEEALSFKRFGEMSGREEFTEKRLRMGRSRFLLYRKLMREGEDGW